MVALFDLKKPPSMCLAYVSAQCTHPDLMESAAKADRLKQAKAEAEKEIKAYKAQREEQYQKRIAEVLLAHSSFQHAHWLSTLCSISASLSMCQGLTGKPNPSCEQFCVAHRTRPTLGLM